MGYFLPPETVHWGFTLLPRSRRSFHDGATGPQPNSPPPPSLPKGVRPLYVSNDSPDMYSDEIVKHPP